MSDARSEDEVHATRFRLRIRASQVVRVATCGEKWKLKKEMDDVKVLPDGMVVVDHAGKIVEVGPASQLESKYPASDCAQDLDLTGKTIVPGFVDAHTHPVWSGNRVNEFKMKLAGATYMDIHAMGGGIGYTVGCTRAASEDELLQLLLARLARMLRAGTTLVEAKSGYGLNADTEIKMLRVIERAKAVQPLHIVANYCGAHSVPKGSTADEATADVIERQLPEIMRLKASGEINPEQIDVFCEKGVFTTAQARAICEAGQRAGLGVNFHGDELNYTGSCEMAGEIGAVAVSHVECVSDAGVAALAEKGVAAVLLPTTAYVLRIHPPPARKLIDAGVPVALGSDFNPNAHCMSMPFVMNLACVTMRMTVNEALVAATLNAAAALGKSLSHGSIEAGKQADFVVIDAPLWEHVVYELCDPPIGMVIKGGRVVSAAPAAPAAPPVGAAAGK